MIRERALTYALNLGKKKMSTYVGELSDQFFFANTSKKEKCPFLLKKKNFVELTEEMDEENSQVGALPQQAWREI